MAVLCQAWAWAVVLRHIMTAWTELTGSEAMGTLLGIRSLRIAERVLHLWWDRLSGRDRSLLTDYGRGTEPDRGDTFSEIRLVARFRDQDGTLLRAPKTFFLHAVDKQTLFRNCVKALNRCQCVD